MATIEIGIGQHLVMRAQQQLMQKDKSKTIMVSKDDPAVIEAQHRFAVALYLNMIEGKDIEIAQLKKQLAESETARRFAEEQAASWKKKCAFLADSLEAFKQGKQVVKPACFFPQPQQGKNDTTASVEVNNFKLVVGG